MDQRWLEESNSFPPTSPKHWDTEQLVEWMKGNGFQDLCEAVEMFGFDGSAVVSFTSAKELQEALELEPNKRGLCVRLLHTLNGLTKVSLVFPNFLTSVPQEGEKGKERAR
jgi:hypothetical protein